MLAGDPKSEVGGLNDEGGTGENIKALSAYAPVRIDDSAEPVGVLELYTTFDEVNADAMETVKPVAIALVLALLLLYASLFPILRQVTGALEARTRRLQQQSDELEKSIAERKQALASLREADARYRALVEELPLVSYVSSLDNPGLSTYVSPQLEDLLGYTPEEWLATPGLFWDVIHPDDAERVRNEHRIGYANAETFSTQYRLRAKNGRVIWVEDQTRIIHDGDGQAGAGAGIPDRHHRPQEQRPRADGERGPVPRARRQHPGRRLPLRHRLRLDDGVPERRDRGARRLSIVGLHRQPRADVRQRRPPRRPRAARDGRRLLRRGRKAVYDGLPRHPPRRDGSLRHRAGAGRERGGRARSSRRRDLRRDGPAPRGARAPQARRDRRIVRRRDHVRGPRRHRHELEQGRRANVRLHGRRDDRTIGLGPRPGRGDDGFERAHRSRWSSWARAASKSREGARTEP